MRWCGGACESGRLRCSHARCLAYRGVVVNAGLQPRLSPPGAQRGSLVLIHAGGVTRCSCWYCAGYYRVTDYRPTLTVQHDVVPFLPIEIVDTYTFTFVSDVRLSKAGRGVSACATQLPCHSQLRNGFMPIPENLHHPSIHLSILFCFSRDIFTLSNKIFGCLFNVVSDSPQPRDPFFGMRMRRSPRYLSKKF